MHKTGNIFYNPAVNAMRAMVLSAIDQIEWRHHGIGVLQGYIKEHSEPEVRIHIWSKKLIKPGMVVSGDSHDHRFNMVSHVLSGLIDHEELIERPDPKGKYTMMALTNARAAVENNYHGPTTQLSGRFSIERRRFRIKEGSSYKFPAYKFHRTPLWSEVTVTCVEKYNQEKTLARLIYPIDHEPIMAFGHKPDQSMIKSVVAQAKEQLK